MMNNNQILTCVSKAALVRTEAPVRYLGRLAHEIGIVVKSADKVEC